MPIHYQTTNFFSGCSLVSSVFIFTTHETPTQSLTAIPNAGLAHTLTHLHQLSQELSPLRGPPRHHCPLATFS